MTDSEFKKVQEIKFLRKFIYGWLILGIGLTIYFSAPYLK